MSDSLRFCPQKRQRLLCPPLSPGVCSNSCPLSHWYYPTISSCVTPFSFCLQSFPASGSLQSWLFASGGQSIRASATASVLRMNIYCWFPLGLTGLISLLPKWLSRVFSSTTIWKHQLFGAQPSLWSNSHICTWVLGKPWLWHIYFVLRANLHGLFSLPASCSPRIRLWRAGAARTCVWHITSPWWMLLNAQLVTKR